jgi:hypothetical protein
MANSPAMDGLRLVYRQPVLGLAEVAWRWTVATAAWLLLGFLVIEYIDSLAITRGDLLLLRSGVPWLVMASVRRILMSGAGRFAAAALIVGSAVGVLWIFAASLGRAALIRAVLDSIRPGAEIEGSIQYEAGSLLGLHCLRVGLFTAAVLAWTCAAFLVGFAPSGSNRRSGLVLLLLFALGLLIAGFWRCLDWVFSIAPIFTIRNGSGTLGSVSSATRFVLERKRAVVGAGTSFAAIHLVAFLAASSIASVPLTFLGILPARVIVPVLVLLILVYFAVIDFLHVAKLAAYIAILALPEQSGQPALVSHQPRTPPVPGPRSEDESASDIPGVIRPPEPV